MLGTGITLIPMRPRQPGWQCYENRTFLHVFNICTQGLPPTYQFTGSVPSQLSNMSILPNHTQVDSVYFRSFGRRKSWLIPAQLLCGAMMLWARGVMDDWIGEDGGEPQIKTLTAYFLALYFIMATQVF